MRAFTITDHIKTSTKETCIAVVKSGLYGKERLEACTKINGKWITDRKGLPIKIAR